MTAQQIHSRYRWFVPAWNRAYAAKDWETCQRCKAIYDRLWALLT